MSHASEDEDSMLGLLDADLGSDSEVELLLRYLIQLRCRQETATEQIH